MKAMCIQALPSTLLSCQEQNNLGNVYSSRSIHIVYVYSSPCVHIHHVYLSSTFTKRETSIPESLLVVIGKKIDFSTSFAPFLAFLVTTDCDAEGTKVQRSSTKLVKGCKTMHADILPIDLVSVIIAI